MTDAMRETMSTIQITYEQWHAKGVERYGNDMKTWRFTCPMCKKDTIAQEWIDHKADKQIGVSCIGRQYDKKQSAFFTKNIKPIGCDYAGYGLFKMNPIHVEITTDEGSKEIVDAFDFTVDPLLTKENKDE